MKWTFASTGMILVGLFGILIIILFHEITVSNEQDYYTLKEATEASMIEAIDSAYYRLTGKLKMNEEKFVENFTKRFIKSSTYGQGNYYVDFYQISEYPAKVSLRIVDDTNSYNIFTTFDESIGDTKARIVNELSAIIDGYEIDDTYDYIEGSYADETVETPGGEAPPGASSPKCPLYEQMKGDSLYKVYNLLMDYTHGKCSFMAMLNLQTGEWNIAETPMGYTYITDDLECSGGSHLSSGWCVK